MQHVIVIDDGTAADGRTRATPTSSARRRPTNRRATSTRTRPRGCSTRAARPASRRARCSPTATSPWPMLESVIEYEPQPDERNLVAFPLCHVAGYTVPVTHMRGGRIVLTPMFEPELWMQLVDEHGITGTAMAPTMLNMVLQHPKLARLPARHAARHRLRRGGDAGRGAARRRSSASARSCTRASA